MKKFLLMMAAAFTTAGAMAIEKPTLSCTSPVANDGTHQYIVNVETGMFLVGANDWNTRLSVSSTARWEFWLETGAAEGQYKLANKNVSKNNATKYTFVENVDNGNIYTDMGNQGKEDKWTFTEVGTNIYQIGSEYIAGASMKVIDANGHVSLIAESTDTWAFVNVTEEEVVAKYAIDLNNYKAIVEGQAKADAAGLLDEYNAEIAEIVAAYEAGTLTENKVADINAAYDKVYNTSYIASKEPGADVTAVIVNPNFDGNVNGWIDTFTGKLNHGFQNNSVYGPINQFMECWAGSWSGAAAPYLLPNGKLYQSVYLPKGEYTLSADIIATQQQAGQAGYIASLDEVTGIYIYAQSDVLFKSDACNATGAEPKNYSFTFNTTGGPTELGLLIENTNCNWAVMDNVKLVYNGESTINVYQEGLKEAVAAAEDLSAVEANAAAKQAYADAISAAATAAENNGQSDEYYLTAQNNLNSTKTAVLASIEVYKEIAKINEKAAQLKGEAAAAAYAEALATYNNGTATEVAPFEAAYAAAFAVAEPPIALPIDNNDWVGMTGNVTEWACPDMPGAPERFAGAPFVGDVMTKTITGLKPGTYTVVLRGGASTTGERDKFEVLTGQNRAYLFANDALYSMEVFSRTSIGAGTVETATLTCGVKEDGVLKMGIQNKTLGANWFVVNLVSITYESAELPTTEVELAVTEAQWATFIAPFDADLPAGVTAYTVDGVENDRGLVLNEQSSIKANTPVILFCETPVTETIIGVSKAEAATYTVGLLTGVYAKVEITEGYVMQNQKGKVGFYKVDSAKTVPANKCYLTVSDSNVNAFYFDQETAIQAVEALAAGKAQIFDLQGRQQQKLQKGLNIVNGVKVLVK